MSVETPLITNRDVSAQLEAYARNNKTFANAARLLQRCIDFPAAKDFQKIEAAAHKALLDYVDSKCAGAIRKEMHAKRAEVSQRFFSGTEAEVRMRQDPTFVVLVANARRLSAEPTEENAEAFDAVSIKHCDSLPKTIADRIREFVTRVIDPSKLETVYVEREIDGFIRDGEKLRNLPEPAYPRLASGEECCNCCVLM